MLPGRFSCSLPASKVDLEQAYATTWSLVPARAYNFDMTKARRFILQAIDPDHGSPVFEALFTVGQIEDLRKLLGEAAEDDPDLRKHYTLEPEELAAISERFDVGFDPGGRESILAPWTQSRECPYLIHTGYELV